LKLCQNSAFRQNWIDDIEWNSLLYTEDRDIVGVGKIWFGRRQAPCASLQSIDFDASFRLLRSGRTPKVCYLLSIKCEGGSLSIRSKDHST
jgi:hypothetical protein